jgi:hypothetical protein
MVRHMGWGLLKSDAVDARDPETGETYHIPEYSFSGGGAMNRNGPVSWTTLDGPDPERVYDFEAAKTAVAELQEAAEGMDAWRDERLEQAYSDAVAAILTADPTLAPARVLQALDYDGESLGMSGPHAHDILDRVGHNTINEAEIVFFARLDD